MESTQKQLSNPENQEAQQPNQLEIIKDNIQELHQHEDEAKQQEQDESESIQYLLIVSEAEGGEDQDDADDRSVFVKNVDYSADAQEVKNHFQECGEIKRVTIPVDKFSGQAKGHAYIEFGTKEGAMKAKRLTDSLFKGRQITVIPKRKNVPGRGRGSARGKNPMMQLVGMLQMAMTRGGRGGRGRGGFRGMRE